MIELPPAEPEPEKAAKPAARRAGPATQWKKSAAPPSSRGGLLALATLLFCGVAGVAIGFVFFFTGAAKPPYFVTLPVESYGRNYPAVAAAHADADWLLKVFDADRRENATNLVIEAGTFRKKLGVLGSGKLLPDVVGTTERQLEPDRALVVHVVCHAAARDGKVYLLPGDAAGDPAGWVPLDELLDAIKDCPARDKCLLLDVGRPRTRTFAGPHADDAAAPLHAHLKARLSEGRLPYAVIASCGEREQSHVMGVVGVSAFAYYAAEGLRGAADGAVAGEKRDDSVTVRELDAFLKLRVGRWAKRNRDAAQSPVLYAADGQDFKITYSAHKTPPATTEEADDKLLDPAPADPYRDLASKWALAPPRPPVTDDPPAGRSIFAVPVPAGPPAVVGTLPPADPGVAVAAAFDKLWRAKSDPTKAGEAKAKFDEAAAALSPELLGSALWTWLVKTHPAPKTDLLQLLRATLAPLKSFDFRELATLDFVLDAGVADSTGQGEAVAGKLFAAEREFAELLKLGDGEFAWVKPQARELVARQRAIEQRIRAGQLPTLAELEALRAGAADAAAALRAAQEARAALDFAVTRLAGTAHAVAEFGRPREKSWNACLEVAARLADRVAREPAADWKAADWRQVTAELKEAVKPLVTPYEPAAVKALTDSGPKAGAAELRDFEATRANPFLAPKDRDALGVAINEVTKRLHLTTRKEFDLPENESGKLPGPERVPETAAHDAPRARLEVSRRLHALAGLGTVATSDVAGAWIKERRVLAADMLKKGDVAKLDRLVAVAPFGPDGTGEPPAGVRELRAARRQAERDDYLAWRASCSR